MTRDQKYLQARGWTFVNSRKQGMFKITLWRSRYGAVMTQGEAMGLERTAARSAKLQAKAEASGVCPECGLPLCGNTNCGECSEIPGR